MDSRHLPPAGFTAAGKRITLGGFSGLAYEGTTRDGKYKFVTHTDRGPNRLTNAASSVPSCCRISRRKVVRFTLDLANGDFELEQPHFPAPPRR